MERIDDIVFPGRPLSSEVHPLAQSAGSFFGGDVPLR
jgi:hypothetical protein